MDRLSQVLSKYFCFIFFLKSVRDYTAHDNGFAAIPQGGFKFVVKPHTENEHGQKSFSEVYPPLCVQPWPCMDREIFK